MNEKGLTIATQSLYRSEYPMWDEQSLNPNKTLVWTLRLAGWLLGNFANVTEVEQAIQATDVVVSNLGLPREAGFHWSIADAQGNSIVLEFQQSTPKIYRNTDWQVVQYPRGHVYMTANSSSIPGAMSSTTAKYGFLAIESRASPGMDDDLTRVLAKVTV